MKINISDLRILRANGIDWSYSEDRVARFVSAMCDADRAGNAELADALERILANESEGPRPLPVTGPGGAYRYAA